MPLTVVPTAAHAQQITTSITGKVTNESGAAVARRDGHGHRHAHRGDATTSRPTRRVRSPRTNLTTGGPYTVTANARRLPGPDGRRHSDDPAGPDPADLRACKPSRRGRTAEARSSSPRRASGQRSSRSARARLSHRRCMQSRADLQPRHPRRHQDGPARQPRPRGRGDRRSGQDRISCLGGNDRCNTFTVDGIPQSDIYGLNDTGFSSRSSTPIPYDAVRETQVQFAPFDVEYGGFTGCAINVVTKSGSNRFHGSGFYEFSNNDLRGDKRRRTATSRRSSPTSAGAYRSAGRSSRTTSSSSARMSIRRPGSRRTTAPRAPASPTKFPASARRSSMRSRRSSRTSMASTPARWSTTGRSRTSGCSAASTGRSPIAQRLELTYQRLKENTVKTDDCSPDLRQLGRDGAQQLLQQRHQLEILLGSSLLELDRPASRPSSAIRARTSWTSRIRSAAARRSRAIRSRASSSASTTRRSDGPSSRLSDAVVRLAQACRARPMTLGPSSTSSESGRQL